MVEIPIAIIADSSYAADVAIMKQLSLYYQVTFPFVTLIATPPDLSVEDVALSINTAITDAVSEGIRYVFLYFRSSFIVPLAMGLYTTPSSPLLCERFPNTTFYLGANILTTEQYTDRNTVLQSNPNMYRLADVNSGTSTQDLQQGLLSIWDLPPTDPQTLIVFVQQGDSISMTLAQSDIDTAVVLGWDYEIHEIPFDEETQTFDLSEAVQTLSSLNPSLTYILGVSVNGFLATNFTNDALAQHFFIPEISSYARYYSINYEPTKPVPVDWYFPGYSSWSEKPRVIQNLFPTQELASTSWVIFYAEATAWIVANESDTIFNGLQDERFLIDTSNTRVSGYLSSRPPIIAETDPNLPPKETILQQNPRNPYP